jgi:hypothetical protein
MHKNLLAFAAVIAATGFLAFGVAAVLHSVPSSQAQDFGPIITGGEAPWVSLSGTLASNSDVDIYTVPVDHAFVLTGLCTSTNQQNLKRVAASGTTIVARGQTGVTVCNSSSAGGYLARGVGRIEFGPGDVVRIHNSEATTREYSLQGYLAAP